MKDNSEQDLGAALTGLRLLVPDLFESRPLAAFGGRSLIETNNPELGPTETELLARQKEFEQRRRKP